MPSLTQIIRKFQNGFGGNPVHRQARAGASINAWVVLSILVDDVPDGSAIVLERLDDPAVMRDAVHRLETCGEHVAA